MPVMGQGLGNPKKQIFGIYHRGEGKIATTLVDGRDLSPVIWPDDKTNGAKTKLNIMWKISNSFSKRNNGHRIEWLIPQANSDFSTKELEQTNDDHVSTWLYAEYRFDYDGSKRISDKYLATWTDIFNSNIQYPYDGTR